MTALQYYIEGGVRRAVAARELGLLTISATLHEDGMPSIPVTINISDLFSPKASISRSDARYVKVLRGMSSPQTRALVPAIDVQPLSVPNQTSSVPLSQVTLDP